MLRMTQLGALTVAVMSLTACNSSKGPAVRPGALIEFALGEGTIDVEVVFEVDSRRAGLMGRTKESLPENRGMLFIYPRPERLSFWMRDTLVPLSIAFIDDEGKILQIEDMKPKDTTSIRSKYRVRYALEMNQGWFERAKVGVGSVIPDFQEKVDPFLRRAEPSPSNAR